LADEVVKVEVEPVDVIEEQADSKREVNVKSPKSFEVIEVEVTGDLVILKGWTTVFKNEILSSRVYKRVR